jgi:cytochrome P450
VLKLLTDELRSVPEERGLTLASTATMPYLNGVIKEGMRLCHPVPSEVVGGHFVPGNQVLSPLPQLLAN